MLKDPNEVTYMFLHGRKTQQFCQLLRAGDLGWLALGSQIQLFINFAGRAIAILLITKFCRRGQQEASFEEVAFGRFLRINFNWVLNQK